jgi:hypothetical protein
MTKSSFKIRPLLHPDVIAFVEANIEAGFLQSEADQIESFKEAITAAEHIGVVEIERCIKGGIMIFRRWQDAIWVTNIFVERNTQHMGISTALYKYVLEYCSSRKIKWLFCNASDRISSLYQRWGGIPINSWETISLVAVYIYFFEGNISDIAFPFRVTFEENRLSAENEDMEIQLSTAKQLLKVAYKNLNEKVRTILVEDIYKLRLQQDASCVKIFQDWFFDTKNGLLLDKKRNLIVYAPTASKQNFVHLTTPIDDVKTPIFWEYSKGVLHMIYSILDEKVRITLTVIFKKESIELTISSHEGFIPRITIEHDRDIIDSLKKVDQIVIRQVRYNNRSHTICSGNSNQLCFQILRIPTIHKKYLRTFIPRSHRPYIRGVNYFNINSTMPLAAAILDAKQRKVLMSALNDTMAFSEEGNKILNEIKNML